MEPLRSSKHNNQRQVLQVPGGAYLDLCCLISVLQCTSYFVFYKYPYNLSSSLRLYRKGAIKLYISIGPNNFVITLEGLCFPYISPVLTNPADTASIALWKATESCFFLRELEGYWVLMIAALSFLSRVENFSTYMPIIRSW